MKSLFTAAFVLLVTAAFAQVPDVQVKADLGPTYRNQVIGGSSTHWYDPFGHHSTISLQFGLEPGFRAFVSQKIERIRHDGDRSPIDESYVEDQGVWRAGKQYLPFGQQRIIRESVVAIRSDTQLFLHDLPMRISACDGGSGRERGIVGRIGQTLGVSFAVGEHFGIAGTSLTQIRLPTESPGAHGGYRQIYGLDARRNVGVIKFAGEFVALRGGELDAGDKDVLDITATLQPSPTKSLTLGYTAATNPGLTSLRLQGSFLVTKMVWLEPYVRSRNGRIYDTGFSLRVRL